MKGEQEQRMAISILVVCTGNICRSPTGEGVLRALAQRRGLADRVRIESAGTHDYHVGEAPIPQHEAREAPRV
jgi:protein-tyrosine phosphatase